MFNPPQRLLIKFLGMIFMANVAFWLMIAVIFNVPGAQAVERDPNSAVATQVTTSDRVAGKNLTLIKLVDGTRCIIIESLRSAGIDCDWSDTRLSEQQPRGLGKSDPELSVDQLLRERQK